MNRRRIFVVRVVVVSMLLEVALVALAGSAGAAIGVFADEFVSISYFGSDGDQAWSVPWTEMEEVDGPGNGVIRVVDQPQCPTRPCLRLGRGAVASVGLLRVADLGGAGSATLTFSYWRDHNDNESTPPGHVDVLAAASPSGPWALLARYPLDVGDSAVHTDSFAISGFISPATTIRFQVINEGTATCLVIAGIELLCNDPPKLMDSIFIDSVRITAAAATPATTTTSSVATTTTSSVATTTTSSAVTTTLSSAVTTTTTAMATTTTTTAMATTTTTVPEVTTTIGPGSIPTTSFVATTTTTAMATTTTGRGSVSTTTIAQTTTTVPEATTTTTTTTLPDARTVVTFARPPTPDADAGIVIEAPEASRHLSALTRLGSLFTVDSEDIQLALVQGFVLGLVVAGAGLRMLDFEDRDRPPTAGSAP